MAVLRCALLLVMVLCVAVAHAVERRVTRSTSNFQQIAPDEYAFAFSTHVCPRLGSGFGLLLRVRFNSATTTAVVDVGGYRVTLESASPQIVLSTVLHGSGDATSGWGGEAFTKTCEFQGLVRSTAQPISISLVIEADSLAHIGSRPANLAANFL